jgi:ParB-like chromosome segregation protein Spo0J
MPDVADPASKQGLKERSPKSRAASRKFGRFAPFPLNDLRPDPRNPRKHDRAQIEAIARSIEAFGFNAPILIDSDKQIVAGHGRYAAAKLLGLAQVPVICLEHLTKPRARAYMLADNKLTDRSSWDEGVLALHLKELSELALDFDIEDTGFELPEIDFHIQSLDSAEDAGPSGRIQGGRGSRGFPDWRRLATGRSSPVLRQRP